MQVNDSTLPPHEQEQPRVLPKIGITLQQYKDASALLQCEPEAIMAVDTVESQGCGFLSDGKIKILFEPHIFWKRLIAHGIDPEKHTDGNEDILYQKWQPGKYGLMSAQPDRLLRASAIHKVAAYESCSWGRYQIMGFNFASCGYTDVLSFVDSMSAYEESHLINFCKYIKRAKLDSALRAKMWAAFAEGYNGSEYKKNAYDTKLQQAYNKAVQQLTT